MEFEQVIELDSVKNQDNTNMVLKVNKLIFVLKVFLTLKVI